VLDGFGTFTATAVGSCYNDVHVVATHPALTPVDDAILSNWSCSVHEGFDIWPASFSVLAIAENAGEAYTAGDGTVGTPYILARGVTSLGCGDGTVLGAEECDDGNNVDGDGCDANCRVEACGNGVLQAGEQCDDGNLTPGDGCSEQCTFEPCTL
jgi:cysteine-rich repeat protein